MKNPKFWPLISLILVVIMLLTACQPASPAATEVATEAVKEQPVEAAPTSAPQEPTAEPAAEEVIEITMWDIPESEPYTAWWEDYVKRFNEANSDIKVTLEVFETEPYKTKITAALTSGTAADIIYQMAGPDAFKYFAEGKMLPLDDLLDVEKFSESALGICSYEGKVACMPLYLAPNFVYYNKKMFAEAGIDTQSWGNPLQPTWEEFLAACDALKAAGFVPIALGNADQWPGMMWYAAFQNRFGGNEELYAARDGEGGVTFTSPGFIKAGELVQELDARGYLPVGYNGIGGGDKYSLFTQEEGAIIYQGPWMMGYIVDEAPEGFEFGIFNFPSFKDGNPDSQGDVMAGVDALWITSTTKHPEAAAKFLNGFAEKENAISFMNETKNISVIKGVAEYAEDEAIKLMVAEAPKAPHFIPWWDIELPAPIAEAILNNIQALFAREITPEQFAQLVQAAAEQQ